MARGQNPRGSSAQATGLLHGPNDPRTASHGRARTCHPWLPRQSPCPGTPCPLGLFACSRRQQPLQGAAVCSRPTVPREPLAGLQAKQTLSRLDSALCPWRAASPVPSGAGLLLSATRPRDGPSFQALPTAKGTAGEGSEPTCVPRGGPRAAHGLRGNWGSWPGHPRPFSGSQAAPRPSANAKPKERGQCRGGGGLRQAPLGHRGHGASAWPPSTVRSAAPQGWPQLLQEGPLSLAQVTLQVCGRGAMPACGQDSTAGDPPPRSSPPPARPAHGGPCSGSFWSQAEHPRPEGRPQAPWRALDAAGGGSAPGLSAGTSPDTSAGGERTWSDASPAAKPPLPLPRPGPWPARAPSRHLAYGGSARRSGGEFRRPFA